MVRGEMWFNSSENLLLWQRTWVRFSAPKHAAYNHLLFQLQGICCPLLDSVGICTHMQILMHIHTHIITRTVNILRSLKYGCMLLLSPNISLWQLSEGCFDMSQPRIIKDSYWRKAKYLTVTLGGGIERNKAVSVQFSLRHNFYRKQFTFSFFEGKKLFIKHVRLKKMDEMNIPN